MGLYFGVDNVKQLGTQVDMCRGKMPNFRSDEDLIFIPNTGLYEIAALVTDVKEFQVFYGQYENGYYLSFELYKLKHSDLVNCPDKGRKYL